MLTQLPYSTLPLAEGTIQASETQQERLDQVTVELAKGTFHIPTTATIPSGCKDGRDTSDGITPKPDSAGGTLSFFVADDLTSQRFATDTHTTADAFQSVLSYLTQNGYEVGGHSDDLDHPAQSGCGANDRLNEIYDFIVRHGKDLQDIARSLGVDMADDIVDQIMTRASVRTDFSTGQEILSCLETVDADHVDHLIGKHKEVAAVLNTRAGTTLDRVALAKEFGTDYQSFNVDIWTFEKAARIIATDEEDYQAKFAAFVFYNLSTAHVLGGKELRIIVLN
jgi:hypothetical protein